MSKNYSWMSKSNENEEVTCLLALGWMGLKPALVMWIWNWIAVSLFAAPTIGYWQAFGLNLLCGLLIR